MSAAGAFMGSPLSVLAPFLGSRWGTVVHVGGGLGAAPVSARRLLAFDGDPASCARLRAATRGRQGVDVFEQVIAEVDGPATWHQHSWRAVDGLRDLSGELSGIYPRLRLLGQREVHARTLARVLEEAGIQHGAADDPPNALVLDLPSGAEALLRALAPEQLMAFDWVIAGGLREGRDGPGPDNLRPQAWPGSSDRRGWQVWQVDHAARRMSLELATAREELSEALRCLDEARHHGAELAQQVAQQAEHLQDRERHWNATLDEYAARMSQQDEALRSQLGEIAGLKQRLEALARAEAKVEFVADLLLAERLK